LIQENLSKSRVAVSLELSPKFKKNIIKYT